jgi:hypothetical protein
VGAPDINNVIGIELVDYIIYRIYYFLSVSFRKLMAVAGRILLDIKYN